MKTIVSVILFTLVTFPLFSQSPQYSYTDGTTGNNIPFGGLQWSDQRAQFLYFPYDFGTNVPTNMVMTKIYFRVEQLEPLTTFTDFKISLGQKSITSLTTNWETGLITVLNDSSYSVGPTVANQWVAIDLATPFPYDPNMPLIVETYQTGTVGGLRLLSGGSPVDPSHANANTQSYGSSTDLTATARHYSYQFGFDLISLQPNNTGVISVDSLAAYCAGIHDVYATIKNFGTNQVDSVEIHWEFNGIPQPTIYYKQTIDTLNGTSSNLAQIFLGSANFNSGKDTIKVYTSLPNGVADMVNFNDTLTYIVETALPPTGIAAFNGTTTSMDIEVFGSAGTIDYEYGLGGFVQGTGTVGSSAVNPFTITGLQSSTNYDIYVRSNCGGTDTSTWVGPFNFCTVYNASYRNGFESEELDALPSCWSSNVTLIYGTGSVPYAGWVEVESQTGISAPFSGSKALYIYGAYGVSGDTVMAISPQLSDLTTGDKRIRFHANTDDPSYCRLIIGTMASPNSSILNAIDTIDFQTANAYKEIIVAFDSTSGYNGTDQYIFLAHNQGGITNYIRIDNFNYEAVPDCEKPTNLSISNLAPDSVDLGWKEKNIGTQWEVEYGNFGYTPGNGTSSIANTNPFTLKGLTPDTVYDYYVRTLCGRGDTSYWSGPVSFETPCLLTTAPYYNDFELDMLNADPYCWNSKVTLPTAWVEVADETGTAAPFRGSKALYLYGQLAAPGFDTVMAITTGFSDLTDGNKQIRFFASSDDPSSKLIIGTMASPIDTILNPIDTIAFATPDTYQEVILELTTLNGYNGTDQYIYLTHSLGGTYDYIRIDDFHYEDIPSCSKPDYSSLSIDSLTATSIDFSWTDSGTATIWEIEYGSQGFTLGTGISDTTTSNPHKIIGLEPATHYEAYVRGICGRGDSSYWTGPVKFLTACPVSFDAPYFNGFEDESLNMLPLCWDAKATYQSFFFGAYVRIGGLTSVSSPHAGSQALYLFSSRADSATDSVFAASPRFSGLTAGDKRISFHANSSNPISQLIVGTMSSPNSTVLNPIDTISFALADTYEEVIVKFNSQSGYNGTDEYIYLMHNLGGTNEYIRIDDFLYENIPSCSKPDYSSLSIDSVTATSVDFSWTKSGAATIWEIEYGKQGFTLGTGIADTTASIPYTITGLNPASYYDIYIRSLCGGNDTSNWTGPFKFLTSCPISYNAPYSNGFENDELGTLPLCWSEKSTYQGFFFGSWVEIGDSNSVSTPHTGSQALYLFSSLSDSITDSLFAVSPRFLALTAGDKRISFYANSSNPVSQLIVGTMSSPTSTILNPIDTITFALSDTYEKSIVRFNAQNGYNGTDEYIYLRHNLGGTSEYIRIDDFRYYKFAAIDAGIADLPSPENDKNKCFTATENVTVEINNLGIDTLDFTVDTTIISVDVTGAITQNLSNTIDDNSINGSPLAPTLSIQIPVGTLDMSTPGNYYFDVSLSMENDGITINNNYLDTVVVLPADGGTISGPDTICFGDTVTLSVSNYVGSIQWQSATGANFTDISGADSVDLKVSPSATTSFRLVACGTAYSDTMVVEPVTPSQPMVMDSMLLVSCGDTGTVALVATSTNPNAVFEWFDVPTGGTALTTGGNITSISQNGDTLYYRSTSIDTNSPAIDTFYVQEVVQINSGICVSIRDTAIATIDCLVGMDEPENSFANISIQPNPSKGIFHIIGKNVKKEMEISIYNTNGKLVYHSTDKFSNNFKERIDISGFAKGLYFVKLQEKQSFEMRKIVIN